MLKQTKTRSWKSNFESHCLETNERTECSFKIIFQFSSPPKFFPLVIRSKSPNHPDLVLKNLLFFFKQYFVSIFPLRAKECSSSELTPFTLISKHHGQQENLLDVLFRKISKIRKIGKPIHFVFKGGKYVVNNRKEVS